MDKRIHIVAFDIPVPVNYGGAIDIYYKIKALSSIGIKIILHCFQYDRKPAQELEIMCESVHYYPRKTAKTNLFLKKPYIVISRSSPLLLNNLLKDNNPILFEGLHSCFFLDHKLLRNRKKIVRTHNIEHNYYAGLAAVERNIFKRYYFLNEAEKLEKFEGILRHASGIAAISANDKIHLQKKYPNVIQVSAFHPHDKVEIKPGRGNYAFYHGSLEVGENNQAALFLVSKIFKYLKIPLIIAGNRPTKELIEVVNKQPNIELKTNLSSDEIFELLKNAQINILPTFQATGIKLKLLAALFLGRYCIVNDPMVSNTGLEKLCIIRNKPEELKQAVAMYFTRDFQEVEIINRIQVLEKNGFTSEQSALILDNMIFGKQ